MRWNVAIVNNLNLRKELQNFTLKSLLESSVAGHILLQLQCRSASEEVVPYFLTTKFKFPDKSYDLYWQEISAAS